MKIAVTADLHLAKKEDYPERYNALENILGQIETENIETLFIAGDLFDRDFHNYAEFESLCKKHPQIQIHIIPGNHDAGISEKSIVGPNIHIYTVPTAIEIGSTTFLLVPYKEKARMGEQIASLEEEIKGKDCILISHGDYYGGLKELNPLEPGTYMPLSKENVVTFAPRAVFLGHIHKPVNWGTVYYTGSPCGLDIGETGKRRFLLYDTTDGSIVPRVVATDVVYFEELFVIVPLDNEVPLLKQEIARRIEFWNLDPSDYSKVIVRVEAIGYAMDRSAILPALREGFNGFRYYKDEGPLIEKLSTSIDRQLNTIAEQTVKLIDELEWDFGGDEPEKELLKMAALNVIYGA
jgi:exonuclease SbcD